MCSSVANFAPQLGHGHTIAEGVNLGRFLRDYPLPTDGLVQKLNAYKKCEKSEKDEISSLNPMQNICKTAPYFAYMLIFLHFLHKNAKISGGGFFD